MSILTHYKKVIFSTLNDSLFALNQSDKMINAAFTIFTNVTSVTCGDVFSVIW